MNEKSGAEAPAVVIKKYANRRLYNTATSSYVTLDDLSRMVKEGSNFVVYDAKTGEDITRAVLTQIIVEEEQKGQNLLPISFLRHLVGLANGLGLTTVAECVETAREAGILRREGVGYLQGYYFGKPVLEKPWLQSGGEPEVAAS